MADIVCLGEPLIEFSEDRQAGTGHYLQGFGGDTLNTAVAAGRQGAAVGYITALGADSFGRMLLDLWREEGIDARHVVIDEHAHTGVYFIHYPDGEHRFSYMRNGSAASVMTPAGLPRDYIRAAGLLHVSGISQAVGAPACDTVFEALQVAREAGVTTSYDTNLRLKLWPLARARAVIHAGIAMADIALPGLEDARQLTGLEEPEAIVDFYLRLGPKTVVLTMGADGVIVADEQQRQHIESHQVKALDATGAGDTFDGTLLAELVRGQDAVSAARYANVAAALSTQKPGAIDAIPTRAQVEAARLAT